MSGEVGPAAGHRHEPHQHSIGAAVFAAVFFTIFAAVFFSAREFSAEAALFPRLISIVAMTSAAIVCVQSAQKALAARRNPANIRDETVALSRSDIATSYAGPPFYCLLMALFGFWIASAIFLGGLLVLLGTRRPFMVFVIIVGTLSTIYIAFDLVFGIELPGGMLLVSTGS
jgi:hypothetical protein